MEPMQRSSQRQAVKVPDSLIATVLPTLGSTPKLGRLRLLGRELEHDYPREDIPSLARFVKKAMQGGWVTQAQRDSFNIGDDRTALRVVAHGAAAAMGAQVEGSVSNALPKAVQDHVFHRIAPIPMARKDVATLLKQGLQCSLYRPEALDQMISSPSANESHLLAWWEECLLQTIQSASPLAHKHDCMVAIEAITASDYGYESDEEAVLLRWGLTRGMAVNLLNLPSQNDSPQAVGLRDLIFLACATTQAIAVEFTAPYEATGMMLGYMWEDEIETIKDALGGRPPTKAGVLEIVINDIPDTIDKGQINNSVIQEHTSYEMLIHHIDRHQMTQATDNPVEEWCQGIANLLAADPFMRNPLHDVGGLKDGEGDYLPIAVADHLQERLNAELPALRKSHPGICETLSAWGDWLSVHAAGGGSAVDWDRLESFETEDSIPLHNLIQALPGIFEEAELGLAESLHEEIMQGAPCCSSVLLSPSNPLLLKEVLDAASVTNTLTHFLAELAQQMGGSTYTE